MRVLHLLSSGSIGGIESLCRDYASFSRHENVFVFLWSGGYNADKIAETGSKVYVLNALKKHFLRLWDKIKSICVDEKVNLVITHHADVYSHMCMLFIKRYFPMIRTIAYAHANAEDMCHSSRDGGNFFKKQVLKYFFVHADKTVAISESVKRSLIELFGLSPEHITVIYNGVNIERFCCSRELHSEILQIVYVGRLIEEKGVHITLKALSMLPEDCKYEFVIVGVGPKRHELMGLSHELGIDDKVIFAGERHDVPQILAKSDIFIHVPLQEGFGITIVEAMKAGLTCICSRSGGIPEIINDEENGYLVETDDPDELSKVLYNIIIGYSDMKNCLIRENAIKRAEQFSIVNYTSAIDELVEKVGNY